MLLTLNQRSSVDGSLGILTVIEDQVFEHTEKSSEKSNI